MIHVHLIPVDPTIQKLLNLGQELCFTIFYLIFTILLVLLVLVIEFELVFNNVNDTLFRMMEYKLYIYLVVIYIYHA